MATAMTPEQKREKALQVRATSERASGGRKRNTFNGTEGKLAIGHLVEGYHLHILNDSPGRIQQALDGGWEFVTPEEVGGTKENVVSRNTDLGDKVRFLVGRSEDGQPLYAYLMKIKQEWWEEDQATLQKKNNMVDEAIRSGKNVRAGDSADGFYSPKNGIQYET